MCTGGLYSEEVSQALRYEEPFLSLIKLQVGNVIDYMSVTDVAIRPE